MRYKMTKNTKFVITRFVFFQAQNAPKSVFGRGSAPDPAGELTTLPRPPSWLGRGIPPPPPPPQRLELGASVLRPILTQNPGYASATRLHK